MRGNTTVDYDAVNTWLNDDNEGSTLFFDIDQCDWELKINKSVKIVSTRNTKFVGKGVGSAGSGPIALNISSSNVYISGFTFNNYNMGILTNGSKLTIINNTFTNNYIGINFSDYLYSSGYPNYLKINDSLIENNIIFNNKLFGLAIGYESYCNFTNFTISNNKISNNGLGYYWGGVMMGSGTSEKLLYNLRIFNNTFNNQRIGLSIGGSGLNFLIYNNTFNNNTDIGLYIYHSTNHNITGNIFDNNNQGIYFNSYYDLKGNIISNNTFKNNNHGIYLRGGNGEGSSDIINNSITDNYFGNNTIGLMFYHIHHSSPNATSYNLIENNIFTNNDLGITFDSSNKDNTVKNNIFKNNKFFNNNYGIKSFLDGYNLFNNNKIIGNDFKNNTYGIHIETESHFVDIYTSKVFSNNTIIGNNFTFNKIAIYLFNVNDTVSSNNIINNDKGIVLEGISSSQMLINGSFLNVIYNRIFNNTETFSILNSTVIANLNWWGNNTPFTKYNNITIDSWYVLRLFADDFTTIKNDSIVYDDRFNAILRYELSTNIPVDHDPSYLPMFLVTVYGPNGEKVVSDIRNTSLSFFIEGDGSTHSIRSLSDNEDVILSVKFPERPKPPSPPNPEEPKDPEIPEEPNKSEYPNPINPQDPNPVPNQLNEPNTNQEKEKIANAAMKPTGIPLIAIFLVLLSLLGSIVKKE